MKALQPTSFLFDLDGTLVDSVYDHVLAWNAALQEEGIDVSIWRIHRRIGMSGGLFTRALARETGIEFDDDKLARLRALHELANASYYLNMMGHVCIAWMWLKQAVVANRHLEKDANERDFYFGKLQACRFFFIYELPQIKTQVALLQKMDDTTLMMPVDAF